MQYAEARYIYIYIYIYMYIYIYIHMYKILWPLFGDGVQLLQG